MMVKGYDGREYKWNITSSHPSPRDNHSSLHHRARSVLINLYPVDQILEEIFIPGAPSPLYCDFYLPMRKLMVEVQGEQHYKHTPHFHGFDIIHFFRSQQRDRIKKSFCQDNKINYVALPFNENDDEWKSRILKSVV